MSRNNLKSMLINNQTPALVMFYAPWCAYCQSHLSVLEELAEEFSDRLQVIKVNIDRNIAAALRYSVRATPDFLFFYKGNVLWRKQGQVIKKELLEKVRDTLGTLTLEGVY